MHFKILGIYNAEVQYRYKQLFLSVYVKGMDLLYVTILSVCFGRKPDKTGNTVHVLYMCLYEALARGLSAIPADNPANKTTLGKRWHNVILSVQVSFIGKFSQYLQNVFV